MAEDEGDPRAVRWAKWVSAIVAAPAAVVGLVLLIAPHVRGGDGCGSSPDARLLEPHIDESVRYGSYLERIHASRGDANRDRLSQVGKLVNVRLVTRDLAGELLTLRSSVLTGGEPVREPELKDQLVVQVEPGGCGETFRQPVWIRIPERAGRFKAELRLVDADGVQLDSIPTKPFDGVP